MAHTHILGTASTKMLQVAVIGIPLLQIATEDRYYSPQGINYILCFAKVYIIQSIPHLVFHVLQKRQTPRKNVYK